MSIGSFILILNESPWIAPHILRVLPFIDDMVFYDGGSSDGTLEIIKEIQECEPDGHKVRVFKAKNPEDLKDDYVRLFNQCMHELRTDLAWFLHPDMWVVNPEKILDIKSSNAIAASVKMKSFAGNPGGDLYEIAGRNKTWKNIHRLRNPDLGAHYHGWYGAWDEDVYYSEVTAGDHTLYMDTADYPYEVVESGIEVCHYGDVRDYDRRFRRMKTCLVNQGRTPEDADKVALEHPRVTLRSGLDPIGNRIELVPAQYPAKFLEAKAKYAHLERAKEPACA